MAIDAGAFVKGAREFGAEPKTFIGKKGNRVSPERDAAVDEDVGRNGYGELSLSSGVHVGAGAEAVGGKKDVGVAPGCGR